MTKWEYLTAPILTHAREADLGQQTGQGRLR